MTEAPSRVTAALADRYTIEREIGSGGMAVVYLANDLKHHRHVALKKVDAKKSVLLYLVIATAVSAIALVVCHSP